MVCAGLKTLADSSAEDQLHLLLELRSDLLLLEAKCKMQNFNGLPRYPA
jgi:predicted GNAT family N-acyltransferase